MRKTMIAAAILLAATAAAQAGNVKVTVTGNLCSFEVREGNYGNATDNPVHRPASPARNGETYTGAEGNSVCWIYENNPGDCRSGMRVSYSCASHTTSGTYNVNVP